jgi:hypothetical protein
MDVRDYVLEGQRVALGPLRTDLADRHRHWLHDLEVRTETVASEFDSPVLAARR